MNNKSIQILRGTRANIAKHKDEELLDGQLIYNLTDNSLAVGGGLNGNLISKDPITVRELKGNVDKFETNTTEYDYYIRHDGTNLNLHNSKGDITVDKAPTTSTGIVRKQELDSEATTRSTKDADLQSQINKEVSRAQEAESNLETKKLDKITDKNSIVYVNGGDGKPTYIGYIENSPTPSTLVRRKAVTGAISTGEASNDDEAVTFKQLKDSTAIPFTDLKDLSKPLGAKLIYVGGDKNTATTQYSSLTQIDINDSIYSIDFNGATIKVTQWTAELASNSYQNLLKGHSKCSIKNLSLDIIVRPRATDNEKNSYSVLNTFGGVENCLIKITVNDPGVSNPLATKVRGFYNCDHLVNTKVDIDDNFSTNQSIAYSYCNDLIWCRVFGKYYSEHTQNYGFANCNRLLGCYTNDYRLTYLNCTDILNSTKYYGLTPLYASTLNFLNVDQLTSKTFTLDDISFSPITTVNSDSYSKAYVSPGGGRGISTVPITNNTVVKNSIARRTSTGTIQAADGISDKDVATMKQLRDTSAKIQNLRNELRNNKFRCLTTWGKVKDSSEPNTYYWANMSFLIDDYVELGESTQISLDILRMFVYQNHATFIQGNLSLHGNGSAVLYPISGFIASSNDIAIIRYNPGTSYGNPFVYKDKLQAIRDDDLGTNSGFLKATIGGGVRLDLLEN